MFGFPCFSENESKTLNYAELSDENLAWSYVSCGIENLWTRQYLPALKDFERASTLLDGMENCLSEIHFLLSFGKVIAYDNLGWRKDCQQAAGSLFIIINGVEADDRIANPETNDESSLQECEIGLKILRKLASLASSSDIRSSLVLIVNEMSKALQPSFKYVDSTFSLGAFNRSYNNWQEPACIELCKSHFWKKCRRLAKKVGKATAKIYVICVLVGEYINDHVEI